MVCVCFITEIETWLSMSLLFFVVLIDVYFGTFFREFTQTDI